MIEILKTDAKGRLELVKRTGKKDGEEFLMYQLHAFGYIVSNLKSLEDTEQKFNDYVKILDFIDFADASLLPFSVTQLEAICASLKSTSHAVSFYMKQTKDNDLNLADLSVEAEFLESLNAKITQQIEILGTPKPLEF